MSIIRSKWFDWVFASICAFAAAWVVFTATSRYGAGVSSDSAFYLSTAENFIRGIGFFDFAGMPLIDFPPLYPFILGISYGVSGVTPFVWARFYNIAFVILLVLSTGFLLLRCFPGRRLWFYLGVLFITLLVPLYPLAANIGTDPLYILMTIWFCISAQYYLEKRSLWALLVMTVIAGACALLRWVGVVMIAAQFFIIIIAYRKQFIRGVLWAGVSSAVAAVPLFLWMLRNYQLTGRFNRGVAPQLVDELQNLELFVVRIREWFWPYPFIYLLPAVIIVILVLVYYNRTEDWRSWLYRLVGTRFLPIMIVIGLFIFLTIFSSYTHDHIVEHDHRYQIPLYYFLLVIFFAILDELVYKHLQNREQVVMNLMIVIVYAIWAGYQVVQIQQFVQVSQVEGVVEYNIYTKKDIMQSAFVVKLIQEPPDPDIPIYSNDPEGVYFLFKRLSRMSPRDPEHWSASIEDLFTYYQTWPEEEQAYLIWFKPHFKQFLYDLDAIGQLADMERIFSRKDGEFYLVTPKERANP